MINAAVKNSLLDLWQFVQRGLTVYTVEPHVSHYLPMQWQRVQTHYHDLCPQCRFSLCAGSCWGSISWRQWPKPPSRMSWRGGDVWSSRENRISPCHCCLNTQTVRTTRHHQCIAASATSKHRKCVLSSVWIVQPVVLVSCCLLPLNLSVVPPSRRCGEACVGIGRVPARRDAGQTGNDLPGRQRRRHQWGR